MSDSHHDKFKSLIDNWKETFRVAVSAYIALKRGDKFDLLFGQVILAPARAAFSVDPVSIETDKLVAGRDLFDVDANVYEQIVQQSRKGVLLTADRQLGLTLDSGRDFSAYFAAQHHPFVTDGPRLPAYLIRGTSVHDAVRSTFGEESLDWHLKSADKPFDGLDDLLTFCGLPRRTQFGDQTTLEVLAFSPGQITPESAISSKKATITCRVSKTADVQKAKVGYKVHFKDNRILRGSLQGTGLSWKDEADWKSTTASLDVGDAVVAQTFFSYAGIAMHQWWISDPTKGLNPRLSFHNIFDASSEVFKGKLLQPEGDRAADFEWAVGALFHLLGFSSNVHGKIPKLQHGPDLVAFSPAGNVCVVECTLGLPNQNDKIAKLARRTTAAREGLTTAGFTALKVLPLLATPLTRAQAVAGIDAAVKHQIVVLCKEDLAQLSDRVILPLNADGVFSELQSRVVGSDPGLSSLTGGTP
jgi:hypothetical protein